MSARVNSHDVRKVYPDPWTVKRGLLTTPTRGYCVGGAFCMYARGTAGPGFPSTFELEDELTKQNPFLSERVGGTPGLPITAAEHYARKIVDRNDRADFVGAWIALDEALTYDPQRVKLHYNPTGV